MRTLRELGSSKRELHTHVALFVPASEVDSQRWSTPPPVPPKDRHLLIPIQRRLASTSLDDKIDNRSRHLLPILPPDIIHIIFEHFCDNKVILGHCSLVSREWHQIARVYLFRKILVSVHWPDLGSEPFDRKRLLKIPIKVPECSNYIRELHFFRWRSPYYAWTRTLHIAYRCDMLLSIFPIFSSLRVLTLTGMAMEDCDSESEGVAHQQVKSLEVLNLDNTAARIHTLSRFLSFFPNLTTLNTFECSWSDPDGLPEHTHSTNIPTQLRLQRISSTYADEHIVTLLRNSPSIQTLKSIDFTYVGEEEVNGFVALLKSAGLTLSHVGFGLSVDDDLGYRPPEFEYGDIWRKYIFSSCISLTSLRIGVTSDRASSISRYHWSILPTILSQLPATITTIMITIDFAPIHFSYTSLFDVGGVYLESLESIDWAKIDAIMNGLPAFLTLRLLEMSHKDNDYKIEKMPQDRAELIRSRLPLLNSRRLLHFE